MASVQGVGRDATLEFRPKSRRAAGRWRGRQQGDGFSGGKEGLSYLWFWFAFNDMVKMAVLRNYHKRKADVMI